MSYNSSHIQREEAVLEVALVLRCRLEAILGQVLLQQ